MENLDQISSQLKQELVSLEGDLSVQLEKWKVFEQRTVQNITRLKRTLAKSNKEDWVYQLPDFIDILDEVRKSILLMEGVSEEEPSFESLEGITNEDVL